jgi:hypothetical protein
MAMQGSGGSRNSQTDASINSKVAVDTGGIKATKSQPITGKLGGDMSAMAGSKGKSTGGSIKTVDSQPITGKLGRGMTAMGTGSVIAGKI